LNLRAGATILRNRLVVGVDNLFDHEYRVHVDPIRLMRPGRNFYVRLARSL
jgi:hypothetical protein